MSKVSIRHSKPEPVEDVFWQKPGMSLTNMDSGAGWTYWGSWLACPRRGFLRYKLGLRRDADAGTAFFDDSGRPSLLFRRSLGWLLHAVKEVYFKGSMTNAAIEEAMERLNLVSNTPTYRFLGDEARRLFLAWLDEYMDRDRSKYEVFKVEHPYAALEDAEYEVEPFVAWSTRFDVLLRDLDTGVIHDFEFKHVGSVRAELLTGYSHDPQLLGQARLFPKEFKKEKFAGITVDITVTTKSASLHRIPVVFRPEDLRDFARQMRHWRQMMSMWAALEWPKNYASCKSTYPGAFGGMCEFYDICSSGVRLSDLKSKAPPTGFVRVDQLVRR